MEPEADQKQKNQPDVNLDCRFYRQKYPSVDELVMVEIKHITAIGAYVMLLEYNNIEGMIMLSELSRKRIRSVSKLTRVGRKEIVVVLRVDENKGYIDLSKKRVAPDELAECENRYKKSKDVHSILRHVAQTTKTDIEQLYETIAWPLYNKYPHPYDAFRIAVTDPDSVLEGLEISTEVRESLLHVIRVRLSPKPIKIRSDFSVTCFEFDGVQAIKDSLLAATALATEKIQVSIRLIASPLYVMLITAVDRNQGMLLANNVLRKIMEEIKSRGGNLVVKEQPHFLGDEDDLELEDLIKTMSASKKPGSDLEEEDEGMDVDIDDEEEKS